MARTKEQKKEFVKMYSEKIENSKAVFVLEPNGLDANESVEIKKALYDLESSFNVVKNSLFAIALEESGIKVPDTIRDNQKAVVFSSDKISESAKVIKEFLKQKGKDEKLSILVGFLDGKEIGANQIKELADLPSREIMLGQVLGTMKAPISGFVRVLGGNISNFINVVNAIKDQKN